MKLAVNRDNQEAVAVKIVNLKQSDNVETNVKKEVTIIICDDVIVCLSLVFFVMNISYKNNQRSSLITIQLIVLSDAICKRSSPIYWTRLLGYYCFQSNYYYIRQAYMDQKHIC